MPCNHNLEKTLEALKAYEIWYLGTRSPYSLNLFLEPHNK